MKKIIFRTKDIIRNADVIITEENWNNHIKKEHPEIGRHFNKVKQCIKDPELIRESLINKKYEIYYRKSGIRSGIFKNYYIACIIYWEVKIWWKIIIHRGKLKTAYLTKKPKAGVTRWKK